MAERPGLTMADVHAALAYYYDHREEITADLQSDADFVTELQKQRTPLRLP